MSVNKWPEGFEMVWLGCDDKQLECELGASFLGPTPPLKRS